MKGRFFKLLARAGLIFFLASLSVDAQNWNSAVVPVQGVLISRNTGAAIPGLTASLIHPVMGRSAPSYSDRDGRFGWVAIPPRPEAYYLEIYWGSNLIDRQPVQVLAPVSLRPIRL